MINIYYVGQILPSKFTVDYPHLASMIQDMAANVFYDSLLKGFCENGVGVTCTSLIPKEFISNEKLLKEDSFKIIPKVYRKNTFLRFINNIFITFRQIIKWNKKNENTEYVVFDVLRIGQSIGGLLACKLKKIKTIAIVTDYPGHRMDSSFSITDRLAKAMLKRYDYYVVLSEYMKEELDCNEECSIVIEGIYNASDENDEREKTANHVFTIMYAGSLHYKYGIMELVKAVRQLNYDVKLKIYGRGEAAQEIQDISKTDASICYCGVTSHHNILAEERAADLLVNPRPINEDYANYSFPSKNLEYMASGTPTVLTRIGSLPKEYEEYVIILSDNNAELLKSEIEKVILSWINGDEYYSKMGKKARNFILEYKNSRSQVAKIIDLITR